MKKLFIFMSAALLLTACSSDEPNNNTANEPAVEEPTVRPLDFPIPDGEAPAEPVFESTSVEDFTVGMKNFSVNYFKAACNTKTDDNLVVSPLSAYYALAMLANGADDNTRTEIVNAFGFDNIAMSDLNGHLSKLTVDLGKADEKTTIEQANSLWMTSSFPVYKSFQTVLGLNYGAEPYMIFPSTFQADLNAWCAEKTHGLIKEFPMEEIPAVGLFNALYLKTPWSMGFLDEQTKPGKFHNYDGTTCEVDFMNSLEIHAAYKESEEAFFIELPLGDGMNPNYAFNIAIPKATADIDKCLPTANISRNSRDYGTYALSLPKFSISNHYDITEALNMLGIKDAFNPSASNFARISDNKLFISTAMQANNFAIDEKGIEAASVTGFGLVTSGPDTYEPERIVIDRPFAFSITERTSGAILFMGKVTKL